MQAMITINLRLPVDVGVWLQEEADKAGVTATLAARLLFIKAKNSGLTVVDPA